MENVDKFLAEDQFRKLEGQLSPVCERHCPQSLNCSRGISIECPVQEYIEHLRRHTRSSIHVGNAKKPFSPHVVDQSFALKNELAKPEHGRIKAKLRKITTITQKLTGTGFDTNPGQSLKEIRYLLEELHEFDTMIREVDSMIVRGYFYTCLDRISEKCRNLEEDMRWRLAEKAVEDRNMMI